MKTDAGRHEARRAKVAVLIAAYADEARKRGLDVQVHDQMLTCGEVDVWVHYSSSWGEGLKVEIRPPYGVARRQAIATKSIANAVKVVDVFARKIEEVRTEREARHRRDNAKATREIHLEDALIAAGVDQNESTFARTTDHGYRVTFHVDVSTTDAAFAAKLAKRMSETHAELQAMKQAHADAALAR